MFVFIIGKISQLQKLIFHFISQLGIHYPENQFIQEKTDGADAKFLSGPKAGYRAPDAPLGNQTLFELFRQSPCNILIFQENQTQDLQIPSDNWLKVHKFIKSPETKILFDRYGISTSGIYFIRPDGYIGFRAFGAEFDALKSYLVSFMMPKKTNF
jgi:hypothetical protein